MHDLETIRRMNEEATGTISHTFEISHTMTPAQYDTLMLLHRQYERPRITVVDGVVFALRVDQWGNVRDYIIESDGSYTYEQLDEGNVWNVYDSNDNFIA